MKRNAKLKYKELRVNSSDKEFIRKKCNELGVTETIFLYWAAKYFINHCKAKGTDWHPTTDIRLD